MSLAKAQAAFRSGAAELDNANFPSIGVQVMQLVGQLNVLERLTTPPTNPTSEDRAAVLQYAANGGFVVRLIEAGTQWHVVHPAGIDERIRAW